jgi:hypothetical protein
LCGCTTWAVVPEEGESRMLKRIIETNTEDLLLKLKESKLHTEEPCKLHFAENIIKLIK